jgi:hypothetical protein
MQDLIQLNISDPEVSELFEGLTAGGKVTITVDVTVSELDDERFVATIDEVHDNVSFQDSTELEDEEDYEDYEDEEMDEDDEYEEEAEEEEY